MKTISRFTLILIITLALLVIPAVAHASSLHPQEVPPPSDLGNLETTLKSLAGVAALIAAIVNAGKSAGWIRDGQSGQWSAGLNLLALVGLFAAQMTGYTNLIPSIDSGAGQVAVILSAVIALGFQIFTSRIVHNNVLAGLPVVGKSHSGRQAGESVSSVEIG